ncbi:uncharacterized protein HKW66_Vig0119680 [Vigna angularis]|uniref:RAB6-interacting golgin n=1 Tax=Phaseolus angularis TaxID=3914 RepID=A0A8T0JWD5_PHAAN|nr:uncharacterized protein LOC108345690 isoform X1 [Vigna angularis]KAG2384876.1 uncharacterized protein HKW66_Vig0119680 [Vigna angularis]
MGSNPPFVLEIGPDGIPKEASVISYTEQIIEAEQLQLKKYIEENYSKIRDVERELANLGLEMKLTSGPKKAALEHMRTKIEASTEKIRVAKLKEEQAHKAWESASKAVRDEEQIKQKLCEDLSKLVEESNNSQLSRLEELKRRLEAMNPNRQSSSLHSAGRSSSLDSAIQDGSSLPSTRESNEGSAVNVPYQNNGPKVPAANEHKPQPPSEGEQRNRKKVNLRGKGIGAVPKTRSSTPDWTGSGFNVDGRN